MLIKENIVIEMYKQGLNNFRNFSYQLPPCLAETLKAMTRLNQFPMYAT
jgi:hypothetical protein